MKKISILLLLCLFVISCSKSEDTISLQEKIRKLVCGNMKEHLKQ